MSDLGPRPFRLRVLWILLAAGLLMTVPALRGDILNYDDRNLLLGSEGAFERGPASFFLETYYYAYLPFYGLSYWVDGKLGGGSPVLIHLANALWHVAASYLVFCVLALLLRNRLGALFGALVFLLHPVHVESVAWISGRKEVMSATFLFLAWLLHLKGRLTWALASFVIACFTKATAVVLPGLMLVAALLPRYEGERRAVARGTIPFFLVALLPVVVHLMVGASAGVVREVSDVGSRMLLWIEAWGQSVYHAIAPFQLSIDYPVGDGATVGGVLLGGILLVAAVATAWAYRRRAPVVTFGIGVFFVALLPHNNVFPATDVHVADRYLYVAVFGLAAIVAWAAEKFREGPVGCGLLAILFLVLSFVSASRFRSDEELWTRTIAAYDGSSLAYFQRGISRAGRADTPPADPALREKAIADLEAALVRARLKEHKVKASGALVLPLVNHGRPARALERAEEAFDLLKSIESSESTRFLAQLLYHRGIAHLALGEPALAAADCRAANKLWARYVVAAKEGEWWLLASRPAEAARALAQAAKLDRESPVPWILLAKAERMVSNRDAYRRALEEAYRRAPKSDEVAGEWVKFHLWGASPNFRRAREALQKLPASPRRARLESQVEAQDALYRFRRGKLEAALEAADLARKLGLPNGSAQYDLGQIYMEAGRYDDAVKCFRRSADVLSRSAVHRDAVARAFALKAYQLLRVGERKLAAEAMRQGLDERPRVIDAGAVPLRGEIGPLRETRLDTLRLLACAAVAGDPGLGRDLAEEVLLGEPSLPDRALARTLRGLLRAFTGVDFDGAEDDLRWVVERNGGDKWARYRLAQVWIKSGAGWLRTANQLKSEERRKQGLALIDKAIKELTQLTEAEPEFLYARLLRGQAYFVLDRLPEAKTEYVHIRERDKTMKEVYVHEAALHRFSFVKGGSIETLSSAERFLDSALRLDPNYFDALFELGNVSHLRYDRAGEGNRRQAFHDAVLWYRRAMAINPQAKEPRLEWARLLLKAGQEALAAGEVLRAHQLVERLEAEAADIAAVHKQRVRLNLMPNFGRTTQLRPDAYYAAAGRALEKARKLAPDDPELPELYAEWHMSRGLSYSLSAGKFAAAAKKARELKDKDLYEKKSARAKELAVEQYVKALKAWPEHPDAETVRARIRALAPEFIKLDEEQARVAYEKGIKAYRERRYAEAVVSLYDVLRLFPELVDVRFYLAMALARSGKAERARAELERVANHRTEGTRFPEAMFELGNIFRAKKEPVVARVWYERYIRAMESTGRGTEPGADVARRILKDLK